jgi:serine/threonine-protein kinase
VKPENLMVTPSNRIKIMDFGIARLQDSNTLTATGGQLGTPAYMSLEHLQAKSVVPSSDLYSLGVVAYEMLVGIRPFNESDVWALVGRLLTEPPPHAMDANPDVPIDLDHVIWTMLATDPSQRYPDCDAVIQALTQPRSEQATIT